MTKSLLAALAVGSVLVAGHTAVHAVPIWNEVGDAGGVENPQVLVNGPYDAIAGAVGLGDVEDAYVFHWSVDGDFSVIDTEPPLPVGLMTIALFAYSGQVLGDQITMAADSKAGLSVAGLLAGDYLLDLQFDDDGADPPYMLQFSGLLSPTKPPTQIPEPPSVMLFGAGVVMLLGKGFRRKSQLRCGSQARRQVSNENAGASRRVGRPEL